MNCFTQQERIEMTAAMLQAGGLSNRAGIEPTRQEFYRWFTLLPGASQRVVVKHLNDEITDDVIIDDSFYCWIAGVLFEPAQLGEAALHCKAGQAGQDLLYHWFAHLDAAQKQEIRDGLAKLHAPLGHDQAV
jgi:hypothetical protein